MNPEPAIQVDVASDARAYRAARPFSHGEQIGVVLLRDWLDCVTRNNGDVFVALPMIQRGSVWNANAVANLWDSLLRGMPVGSFTVSVFHNSTRGLIRTIGTRTASEAEIPAGSLSLLDGQQRTFAMCIGWPWEMEMDRRIWVDFLQSGLAGQPFRLRITTKYQPFGFNQSDQSKKLSRWEQIKARSDFDAIPDNAALKNEPTHRLPLSKTKPYGAKHALDVRALIAGWREKEQDLELWCKDTLAQLSLPPEAPFQEVEQRVRAFGSALARLFRMEIALVRVAQELVEDGTDDEDEAPEPALVVLFNRIANAGTPLSRADYVFSLIKHRFPEAHNLVEALHSAGNVASLLSANDLVMTAVRLAANTNTHSNGTLFSDIPTPSPKEFGRMLRAKVDPAAGDFLECALMPLIRNDSRFSLHRAFEEAQRLLSFRDGITPVDAGLPRLAFPLLQRQLVQVLLLWIHRRQRAVDSAELLRSQLNASRGEILRFVLFWLLCVDDREKDKEAAAKAAFEMLREESDIFPGKAMADLLCEKRLAVPLQDPDSIEVGVISQPNPGLKVRGWYARFYETAADGTVAESQPLYRRWFHRKHLLLWLQRRTLTATFQDADPLAGRDDETPYDYDHICPSADWGTDFRSCASPFKAFCEDNSSTIGNSIGNFRVWDSSSNRSDGDAPASVKLNLDDLHSDEAQKILDSSAISSSEIVFWKACSTSHDVHGEWNEERALAFQKAVETRAFKLFRRYFDEVGFAEWVSPQTGTSLIALPVGSFR